MWNAGLHSNMNFPAPLAVLGFLATSGGLLLVLLSMAIACFVRKASFALLLIKLTGAAMAIYFGMLFGFSLASREVTLAPGQEKYFCEIDCHLAYTVLDIKPLTAPDSSQDATSYLVTIRTRFDETTISSHRPKDAPLLPSPRTVLLIDGQGNRYTPRSTGGTPLRASLVPGQSYTTQLQFALPHEVHGLKLLIGTTPAWPDRILIGDENSWLHKKTYFQM